MKGKPAASSRKDESTHDGSYFQILREHIEESQDAELLGALSEMPSLVQWRDDEGVSLLHFAARNGRTKVVAALLSAGADPSCRDHKRRTPLHDAVINYEASLPALVLLLDSGSDIDARDTYWETPLITASNYSNLYAVSVLVALGANAAFKDRGGMNARAHAERALSAGRANYRKYKRQIADCEIILELLDKAE